LDKNPTVDAVDIVLPLLAENARIVHPRRVEESGAGGGDIDCVVSRIHPYWALRLPNSWRLCQCLHYEPLGWYWVLEHLEEFIAVDVIDDPRGFNRQAFPSTLALEGTGPLARDPIRAAYLTAKRIRKGIRDTVEWERIAELAREDPEAYGAVLKRIFGHDVGKEIMGLGLSGSVPSLKLWARARKRQQFRRVAGLGQTAILAGLTVRRGLTRLTRPTGLHVVITGPDGSGKSTVAGALPDVMRGPFRRHKHIHWRPGLLPRLGALIGQSKGDPSLPHARSPYGSRLSLILLTYYWLDFALGSLVRIWPWRIRSTLVLVERGWWDFAVDPVRYRLRVSQRVVRALGRFLPSPDLLVILDASTEALLERKRELPHEELAKQLEAWPRAVPEGIRRVRINASQDTKTVLHDVKDEIVQLLEARTMARLGPGWVGLPKHSRARWILPRGPRRAAFGALSLYQPVTLRGRLGWKAARGLARAGGFRLLPRGQAPPREVRGLLAPHIPAQSTVAIASANHVDRYIALMIGETGEIVSIAKLALNEQGRRALQLEMEALERFRSLLPLPLTAPSVLAYEPGCLVLEAGQWVPRTRPWRLPEEVAFALGEFFRAGAVANQSGAAHGDCAPWNLLLRSDGAWMLVDWEDASSDAPPFFDVFHYVVQAHSLLKRPSRRAISDGFSGKGWIGAALAAYAEGGQVNISDSRASFRTYLDRSSSQIARGTRHARTAFDARRRLRDSVRGDWG
jgi:thymidylate kinase